MFHAAYTVPDRGDKPHDGDSIATSTGWLLWSLWADDHAKDYPHCAHLAQEGWIELPNADLAAELESVTGGADDPDVRSVTQRIIAAVQAAPPGATALIVTDGEPGSDDDEQPDTGTDTADDPEPSETKADCACRHAGNADAIAACLKAYGDEAARDRARRRAADLKLAADYAEHLLGGGDLTAIESAELVEAARRMEPDDLARLWNVVQDAPHDAEHRAAVVAAVKNETEIQTTADELAVVAIGLLAEGAGELADRIRRALLPVPEPESVDKSMSYLDSGTGGAIVPPGGKRKKKKPYRKPTVGALPKKVPYPKNAAGAGSLPPKLKALDTDGVRVGALPGAAGAVAQLLKGARARVMRAEQVAATRARQQKAAEHRAEVQRKREEEERHAEELESLLNRADGIRTWYKSLDAEDFDEDGVYRGRR